LIRSSKDLEQCIALSPKSLLQSTYGLTTLHLAVGWPQGLSRLLETDARLLIDEAAGNGTCNYLTWPFSHAAASHSTSSLDILLEAGCNLYPDNNGDAKPLSCALETTSVDCAKVIATHLAKRRKRLFAIAKESLEGESLPPYFGEAECAYIMDALAGREPLGVPMAPESLICVVLDYHRIPVPRELRAPPFLKDIYQLSGVSLRFFPIFAGCGFLEYNSQNALGLTAVMDASRSP
jgi:hypothetical protein